MVKIDLGCGTKKPAGFIGIDRYNLPNVDIVADLNKPLPLKDNSVDLLIASHSLEHLKDLNFVMEEIYRVCKHGSRICIVAPYYFQGVNLANTYHLQVFNEHTPRFWTNFQFSLIDPEEFNHPSASNWGLSESDHSEAKIDIRCLKMDFFYFSNYQRLSPDEQRAARKKYLDVCDQIVYHLVVVKKEMNEDDMIEYKKTAKYYDPPDIVIRELHKNIQTKDEELQKKTGELENYKSRAVVFSQELNLYRERKIINLLNRFIRKHNLWDSISESFQQLKDDSLLIHKGCHGFKLQPSKNLQNVPFLSYKLLLDRPTLSGIFLAPMIDFPLRKGKLCIQIVSKVNQIVAESCLEVGEINEEAPAQFRFPSVKNTNIDRFELRIFGRDLEGTVRIFELAKYTLFGLGPKRTKPFCGYLLGE